MQSTQFQFQQYKNIYWNHWLLYLNFWLTFSVNTRFSSIGACTLSSEKSCSLLESCFEGILRTDRLQVVHHYTNTFGWRQSSFEIILSRERQYIERQYTHFFIVRISFREYIQHRQCGMTKDNSRNICLARVMFPAHFPCREAVN